MHFIYKVENKVNGKLYVGQTICPANRKKQHLSKTFHGNPALDRAVLKYGRGSFDFSIVEELETLDQANEREVYWIQELNTLAPNGYNLKVGGDAGGLDSPETRRKKSQSKLGAQNHFYGRKHSDGARLKISLAKTGRTLNIPEGDLERRRNQMIRMNNARKGKKQSPELRKKIAASQRGKTHSEETKRKMSEARRKWWAERSQAC